MPLYSGLTSYIVGLIIILFVACMIFIERLPDGVSTTPVIEAAESCSNRYCPFEDETDSACDGLDDPSVIVSDPFPPLIGCCPERFERLTYCLSDGILDDDLPLVERKALQNEFLLAVETGYDTLPVLLNGFQGLDLLDVEDTRKVTIIACLWNTVTGKGFLDLPIIRADSVQELKERLTWNRTIISNIMNLWASRYMDCKRAQSLITQRIECFRLRTQKNMMESKFIHEISRK